MSKEELEKLEREKYVVERKLTAAMHKEKRLQSELKRLTRSERTHRLCTRAGMLETFLKEPTTLTDDDVMELLTFIFHSEAVQKKLDLLIANHLKVVHCVLPKAPCRELMISAVCSNHTGDATLPLRWLCQLPLCGLAAGKRLQAIIPRQQVYIPPPDRC